MVCDLVVLLLKLFSQRCEVYEDKFTIEWQWLEIFLIRASCSWEWRNKGFPVSQQYC